MKVALSFASAWEQKAESDLSLPDYTRRRTILRRQRMVYIANIIGWNFLKVGEQISLDGSVIVGISLDKKEDYRFLDILRLHPEVWLDKVVYIFHTDKPFILPLPEPVIKPPVLA